MEALKVQQDADNLRSTVVAGDGQAGIAFGLVRVHHAVQLGPVLAELLHRVLMAAFHRISQSSPS